MQIINANGDFGPRVQLLECNYYYAMIDSMHLTHVLTFLQGPNKLSIFSTTCMQQEGEGLVLYEGHSP